MRNACEVEIQIFPLGPQHVLRKKVGYLTGVFYARNTGFVRAIDSSYWLFFDF